MNRLHFVTHKLSGNYEMYS